MEGPARGDSDNFRAITRLPDSASASHVSDMFPNKAPSVRCGGKRRDSWTTKLTHTRNNSRVQYMYCAVHRTLFPLINKFASVAGDCPVRRRFLRTTVRRTRVTSCMVIMTGETQTYLTLYNLMPSLALDLHPHVTHNFLT